MDFQKQVIKTYQDILEWYSNEIYHDKTILVESCEITALLVFSKGLYDNGIMTIDEYNEVKYSISNEPFSSRKYEYILLDLDYDENSKTIY